jgi:diacylglycerol kinase (ATP)
VIRVIYNAAARGGRIERHQKEMRRLLDERVGAYEWTETSSTKQGIQLASEAGPQDVVVAVGGDGSIHTVVEGLIAGGGQAALGIIPAGTGNDFAYGMGIPSGQAEAIDVLAAGAESRVDVGWAELDGLPGFPFANAIGFGFDAASSIQSRKRKFLPGVLRYLVSSLETLASWRAPTVVVQGDGLAWEQPLMFATFGNAPRSGGGFLITPDADPADGLLDYCLVREIGIGKALTVIPKVMRGTHGSVAEAALGRGVAFRLSASRSVPVHADGEIVSTACQSAVISIRPGALRVVSRKQLFGPNSAR